MTRAPHAGLGGESKCGGGDEDGDREMRGLCSFPAKNDAVLNVPLISVNAARRSGATQLPDAVRDVDFSVQPDAPGRVLGVTVDDGTRSCCAGCRPGSVRLGAAVGGWLARSDSCGWRSSGSVRLGEAGRSGWGSWGRPGNVRQRQLGAAVPAVGVGQGRKAGLASTAVAVVGVIGGSTGPPDHTVTLILEAQYPMRHPTTFHTLSGYSHPLMGLASHSSTHLESFKNAVWSKAREHCDNAYMTSS
eukprot:352476-Chlamydomonas_euryale.AAC.16